VNHVLNGSDSITEYVVTTASGDVVSAGSNDVVSDDSDHLVSPVSNIKVLIRVYDENRNLVAEAFGEKGKIRIPNVRLWEVRNAYLYTFRILLMDQETIVDEYEEEIGIRTVEVRDTDILINNK
ncbi:hypothetical protein EKL39_25240, partial [Salmonella enterica subsp. enterica serovar Typhimurium]